MRFLLSIEPTDQCIDWPYTLDHEGYGRFLYQNRRCRAHVASLELHSKEAADGRYCLHNCDRPSCVNPLHLRWGTNEENMADMVARRRSSHGERHPDSKMTEQDVRAIRRRWASGETQKNLGAEFGITQANVHCITSRKTWKHVV